MRTIRHFTLALVVFAVNGPITRASADVPLVPERVRQLMQDRDYAGAIQAIEEADKAKDAPHDYLAYLKGRALFLARSYDEATTTFEKLAQEFPQSPWVRHSRFAAGLALARKGEFQKAELIYRAEAEYLLSEDRKQQIADIYLGFAEEFFKPPKEDIKPDFEKALKFYQEALQVGIKPKRRVEVELLVARCHQELTKIDEAAALYEKFIADHASGPLNVEARFRLGECHFSKKKLVEARRAWEDLLAEHADSSSERIAEATYRLAQCWGIPKPGSDEQLSLGVAALEAFLRRFPAHKLAGKSQVEIAESHMHRGRYEDAIAGLKRFLADDRFKDRDEIPDARNLLGRAYQQQKKFAEAIAAWQEYLRLHPAHKAWSEVQRQIVQTEYLTAAAEYEAKKYDSARKLWGEFSAKYPLDERNPAILFLLGRSHHDQERWDAAIAEWRRLVSKYPETDASSQAQLMIAATLEQKLEKLDEALEQYRKLTWGRSAPQARAAVARLTGKSMTIATERIFRSNETPRLKLTSRNIERVTVRAYKVDLETYFRKMHLSRGVEQLDVALIDPDKTFEFEIPKYVKYQERESTIDVPIPGDARAGVMAVTVSSKTLEATTLVIQSDLDLIVKSSRNEVFVFAENMLTGKPWPGARLLVSNGTQVFAEGKTGPDGVFRQAFPELKEAADVRAFAIDGPNVASNLVSLEGLQVATGLTDKGYLYTDRPAYRAGDLVHVRACIRAVSADAYRVEAGKEYTIEVFDNRNRLVHQQKVKLGSFGTLHDRFTLPSTSPQGEYRIQVHDAKEHRYQGTFLVHEYKLEPVHLVVDTPRRVYYRGEEIEGTIRAAFYYGAPLAGRELRYQLAGDRLHTATTDAKGEVRFKLATREFAESQVLPLVIVLPERNLQTAVNFVLATRGFSIDVTTVRPVYLAGESFEVSVRTRDAEGKPLGQKLKLSVLEKTTVDGKVGERLVEEHELATAPSDGVARQTLTVAAGGRYAIRAIGTDRFQNSISGERLVQISDDKDKVRLRILADRHTYKVGDTAEVRLLWRESPALALVTFQGAQILDYRLVELASGTNRLQIPMTPGLAPNFELAIAVMTDPRLAPGEEKKSDQPIRRFHEASSPFAVERDLRVEVSYKRKAGAEGPVRPGEELEVTLTATDPQGKPVAAEVSLAMVEQSLLDRFGWPIPPIQEFFRGVPRAPAVRTTASITFSYRPTTRPIDVQLLAEQDRLEVAREEEASRARGLPAPAQTATPTAGTTVSDGRGFAAGALEAAPTPALDPFGAVPPDAAHAAGQRAAPSDDRAAITLGDARLRQELERRLGRGKEQGGLLGDVQIEFVEGLDTIVARGDRGEVDRLMKIINRMGKSSPESPDSAGFESLIDLITGAVQPQTWDYVAGTGGVVAGFPSNLSLVISQTQDPHLEIMTLDAGGRMSRLSLPVGLTPRDAEKLAAELTRAGATLLPAWRLQETGFWNPAVEIPADGKATVTLAVPERATGWRLVAKGITTDTLAGEATRDLVVKKDLFGELKLPLSFTDGDRASVSVAVHNDLTEKGKIEVTLKTTIGGRSVEEKQTLEVASKGLHELTYSTALDSSDRRAPQTPPEHSSDRRGSPTPPGRPTEGLPSQPSVQFELTITSGSHRDVVRRTVPLLPYGMPVFAATSGSATSDTTAWVEAPPGMPLESPNLQILVGPTVERSLLDIVFAPTVPFCHLELGRIASGLDTAASDLLASLALEKLLAGSRQAGGPEAQSLDSRVRASVSLLVSSQNEDGGWSWTGRGKASDRYGSSRVVWALSLAREAGYTVADDCFNKALGYLRNQLAAVNYADYESQAILLHGLSAAGQGDFALANRLYRTRPSLSSAALAHLALAFAKMDRKPTAGELLDVLAQRNLDDAALRRVNAQGSLPWSHSSAELRALYALAIQEVTPGSAKAKELVDWLLAHRSGHRWSPDKATGVAALALCRWFAASRFQGERYRLTVHVNDGQAKALEIDDASGTQAIEVPAGLLKPGKQRIHFEIAGRGRYTYQCIFGGFVAADKLKSTTTEWEARRTYEPAPLEFDGREVPRGFDVLEGSYTIFRNPLTQLPVGRRGVVELEVWRRNLSANTPEEQLEYLVIAEPIPSGTSVVQDSVTGGFERFEISPGAITFYVGTQRHVSTIRYQLHGYLPGQYRAAPTQVRNAYRPEQLVVCPPQTLTVLPQGNGSKDAYRLTPRELFELGKLHFAKADFASAERHLADLVEHWNLKAEVYQEAVTKLLDVYLKLGPPAKVVRYFEIVKEKWPNEEIPFAKILQVGAAYHAMGEFERAYLIFRATVEGSFSREANVAGFLESQGEFLRSVEVMGRLLAEYPPEGYVGAATYALAQRVYAKAPEAAGDEKLRQQKVNRVDLIRRAWTMLEAFLTAYADDPAADQAAFAAASALLDLEAYDQAAEACSRCAKRYPESELLDSYWYMIGYCRFATARHEAALEMCRQVAEAKRIDKTTGRELESRNKWQAIYILGQIYHSLGKAAEAIREYHRVEDRFADAKEAIEYFLHKAIKLPEVTTLKPGQPAEAELSFRNIATCDTKVYRIDLMKFSLLKRNLGGITQINLSGIRPYYEATVQLGDGKDYADRTHRLPLPLKEEGAYLVVCRGESLHASGLVLVTPLVVEVQEESAAGRVRTTVKDVLTSRYANDVHVKVIGSSNSQFVSGSTDLRGVFVADGIAGTSTVIAQTAPSRYAFFRGETHLGPPPAARAQAANQPAVAAGEKPTEQRKSVTLKEQLLEGLQESNVKLQRRQVDQLQDMYKNVEKGVQASKAF